MNDAHRPSAFMLPSEPYPGLRPFLDHEAALLFGRARQVGEVIERLKQTQFVAVIGGSGSGKSSLIHAGVIPQLRSFGIPGAGDFWVPMVCTPGTNVAHDEQRKRLHTPITRLAWKFSKLLKSRGSPQEDTRRLAEIAQVFRQEAGFSRLVDAYGDELDLPPGPDAGEARLLFVVDQFEELFHPTNKGEEDCRLLVERVIDHFFDPHPRGFVILTMRSEHLNDCAGFLQLPDAINKSSYLVRRLDEPELREAIIGPAQRYLRLLSRQARDPGALPAAVRFDDQVLQRVLRDVTAVTHDPDHLPLLQHLLARLWQSACQREGAAGSAPADITSDDLLRAVTACDAAADEPPLDEKTNVLRASLECWAEAIYRRRNLEQRPRLDAVLRNLAFKDPNTGMYTQQRIDVDDCARFLGEHGTRDDLHALIEDGLLGSVDYLFWDKEDPSRVTLKVSHESFIRGWSHFRQLIDAEAERFEEFVAVLRKCAGWKSERHAPELLLDTAELRRLRDARLEEVLSSAPERDAWFRFLLLDRDGARLARLKSEVEPFLRASQARQRAHDAGRKRLRWGLAAVLSLALLLVPFLLFYVFVQSPAVTMAELFFEAGNVANQTQMTESYPHVGAAAKSLRPLVDAAQLVERGHARMKDRLQALNWIPPVKRQENILRRIAGQVESPVNGNLRILLSSALWVGGDAPRPADGSNAFIEAPTASKTTCSVISVGPDQTELRTPSTGRLFLVARQGGDSLRRGIFVPDHTAPAAELKASGDNIVLAARESEIVVLGATHDGTSCTASSMGLSVPLLLDPSVLFDAGMRYVLVAMQGPYVQQPSVSLYEMNWDRGDAARAWRVQARPGAVVTDQQAVNLVRELFARSPVEGPRVQTMRTWRSLGGRSFAVGAQNWRVISTTAQRLAAVPDDRQLRELLPVKAGADSACQVLASTLLGDALHQYAGQEMFEDGQHCYQIKRRNDQGGMPPNSGPGTARSASGTASARQEVFISVYEKPSRDDLAKPGRLTMPAALASMQFGRYDKDDNRWYVGVAGPYDGWIALRRRSREGEERYVGMPWSTGGLMRLGQDVLAKDQSALPVGPVAGDGRAAAISPVSLPARRAATARRLANQELRPAEAP